VAAAVEGHPATSAVRALADLVPSHPVLHRILPRIRRRVGRKAAEHTESSKGSVGGLQADPCSRPAAGVGGKPPPGRKPRRGAHHELSVALRPREGTSGARESTVVFRSGARLAATFMGGGPPVSISVGSPTPCERARAKLRGPTEHVK